MASISGGAGGMGGGLCGPLMRTPSEIYAEILRGFPTEDISSEMAEVGWLFFFSEPQIIHLGMNARKICQRVIIASLKGCVDALDQIGVLSFTSRPEGS